MRRSSNRLARAVAALALLALLDGRGQASPDHGGAERLLAEGIELRRKHRDLEALEKFEQAQKLWATPRGLAQVGLAEQALGRWVDAERDLKKALAATDDAWIEKNRAALQRAVVTSEERLGTLEIEGAPAGAEVRVDSALVGRLPLQAPLRVPAGTVTVELTQPGHVAAMRSIPIVAKKLHHERIELVPITVLAEPPPRAAPRGPRPHDRRLWLGGWTLLGAGVGLAAVGAAGVGLHERAAQRWNGDGCVGNGLDRMENCASSFASARTGDRLTISGFVLGGTLVLGGIGLLVADVVQRRADR